MKGTLSLRLRTLADMVTPGNRVVDVGCDHGFLPIYLVRSGISPWVLAMDVREGPLTRAREHVAQYGLGEYIETRLSDGLQSYEAGEAETLVCAGMGGRLMAGILREGSRKARSFKEIILQPQSELSGFRRFLYEDGYEITKENILCEEGKFYFLMKAVWTGTRKEAREPLFEEFGERLLRERNPVLRDYLEYRENRVCQIEKELISQPGQRAGKRLLEVREEREQLRKALAFWEQA